MERIGIDCKDKKSWEQSWSIYNDLVKFIYGNVMNRDIENKSKTILAQMIAEFEVKSKRKIFNHIASGLTEDTAAWDLFQRAYSDSIIMIRQKKT